MAFISSNHTLFTEFRKIVDKNVQIYLNKITNIIINLK